LKALILFFTGSFFQQFFPDHGMATIGAFQGSAFHPLLMRYLFTALCTNAKAAGTECSAFVAATSPTLSPAFTTTLSTGSLVSFIPHGYGLFFLV
jgi:hypothetical protein